MLKRVFAVGALAAVTFAGAVIVTHADTFATAQQSRSYTRSALTLEGEILAPSGAPAAGVPVSVTQSNLDGQDARIIMTGDTNSAGWYGFNVPAGRNRLLTVNAPNGGRLVTRELVAPDVSLRVTALPGAVLVLSGRVEVQAGPPTVVLQDLTPTGWQDFAVASPNGFTGGYTDRYQSAPGTVGGRFQFRASTMPTASWQPGVSGVREATVRP